MKRIHGFHLFVCAVCGRRLWTHSKNPNYGKQLCSGCGSNALHNFGLDGDRKTFARVKGEAQCVPHGPTARTE